MWIDEIELVGRYGVLLPYTTTATDAYDTAKGTVPTYWAAVPRGHKALQDGSKAHTIETACCLIYGPSSVAGVKARFLVHVEHPEQVTDIKVSIGNIQRPKHVKVYAVPDDVEYNYAQHVVAVPDLPLVAQKLNTHLLESGSLTITLDLL